MRHVRAYFQNQQWQHPGSWKDFGCEKPLKEIQKHFIGTKLLCILTTKQVLRMPFIVVFLVIFGAFLIFFFFSFLTEKDDKTSFNAETNDFDK